MLKPTTETTTGVAGLWIDAHVLSYSGQQKEPLVRAVVSKVRELNEIVRDLEARSWQLEYEHSEVVEQLRRRREEIDALIAVCPAPS